MNAQYLSAGFVGLLMRLKLQAKRSLRQTIDIEAMALDLAFARGVLDELEPAASGDATLLALIGQLRAQLPEPAPVPAVEPVPVAAKTRGMRDYRFGARS